MRARFHHEVLYRGQEALAKLASLRLVICGAGAVGSNLVHQLVRQGVEEVTVIDFDRVEAHNIGTQSYALEEVGAFKVDLLQAEMFRVAEVEIKAVRKRLTQRNVAKLLTRKRASLVVDGFDNHLSRALVTEYCRQAKIDCLHVGLSPDYAEVLWNEGYRVPNDVAEHPTKPTKPTKPTNHVSFRTAM
jgi:tRNA A37 threonylcarbamoyladenosine dehydratase